MHLSKKMRMVSVALLLGAMTAGSPISSATATADQVTLIAQSRRRLNFRVGVRPSRSRIGAFSRSGCGEAGIPTALVPPIRDRASTTKVAVDKTSADRPTFFVYLPALPTQTAQFTLQDEAGTELYTTEFEVTDQAGIIGITLPEAAPALEIGQKYSWHVDVLCNPNMPSSLMTASSWVERVSPPAKTARDPLFVLAQQGIWQELVTLLALRRYEKPGDRASAEDWAALMEDAGLPQFKQTKILQIIRN